jgi:restriction endonuclease Mrr
VFGCETVAFHRRSVDRRKLASLMGDCSLGVSEERVARTYSIDSDFFEDRE